jgi:hypothetical protein
VLVFADAPFEFQEVVINQGVNDSKIALSEGDFAEGMAIAEKAESQQGQGEKKVETGGDIN